MKAVCLLIACCLGTEEPDSSGEVGVLARPSVQDSAGSAFSDEFAPPIPGVAQAVPAAANVPSCGCTYCAGGYGGWVGNPYTKCSSCRRDGGMWPYDYRRAFDYPWHAPNYAWGSPFVPHAWWPEVEAMFGPGYPYAHHAATTGDSAEHSVNPMLNSGGLLPIPSPPFPTPIERKILRID